MNSFRSYYARQTVGDNLKTEMPAAHTQTSFYNHNKRTGRSHPERDNHSAAQESALSVYNNAPNQPSETQKYRRF
jgi:hypothetical protein